MKPTNVPLHTHTHRWVKLVRIVPNSYEMLSCCDDSTVVMWDRRTRSVLAEYAMCCCVFVCSLCCAGTVGEGVVRVWCAAVWLFILSFSSPTTHISHPHTHHRYKNDCWVFDFVYDRYKIVCGTQSLTLQVLDRRTLQRTASLDIDQKVRVCRDIDVFVGGVYVGVCKYVLGGRYLYCMYVRF